MIGFIIDIIFIIVAVLIIRSGWKNGIVKNLLSVATTVVSIVAAYALTPKLSGYFYNSFILQKISGDIEKTVGSLAKNGDIYDFPSLAKEMPEVLENMLGKYFVTPESFTNFSESLSGTGNEALKKAADFVASPAASIISNALAFILIFIAALIVLKLLTKLILLLFKTPVLKGADRAAGVVIGCVNAIVILWVLSTVLSYGVTALGSLAPSWFGEQAISKSILFRFLADVNPLQVIGKVINYA